MEKLLKKDKKIAPAVGLLIEQAYKVMTSDPPECICLASIALELSKKHVFPLGMAHAYIHIGLGYYHQGELGQALEHYQKAEAIFLNIKNIHGLRTVYNNIGIVYDDWQDCDKALQYYQMNLDLQDEGDDPKIKCNILVNIGIVHFESMDYAAARQCFQDSLDLSRSIGFVYGESGALHHLGKILLKENDFAAALSHFQQAIQVAEQQNLLTKVIANLQSIAQAYLQREDYPNALAFYSQAKTKAEMINDKHNISWIALQLATIYRETGDLVKQKSYLLLCLSLALPEHYRIHSVNALRELAQIYESEGDFQKALKTYWQYQEIKNYMTDQAKNNYIEKLRVQMQVKEKEREMQLSRKSNLALEKKNKLINRQKNKLEKAEKALIEWNHTLELRVSEEIRKRQEQEQILIQKSKLEALGKLAAGIAHEINQPLGMINIGIQNLFNKLNAGQVDKAYIADKAQYFTENIARIRKIIDHIRMFSRDQQTEAPELIDTRKVVEDAISMLKAQCRGHNITLEYSTPPQPILILGNKYRLEQVLLNLLSNAKAAVEERFDTFDDAKHISVRNYLNAQSVIIEVEDNGCGIDAQDLERIFEPFFTTKSESRGTGLGLSICYGIIHDMQGKINCKSQKTRGTVMRITLPACQ